MDIGFSINEIIYWLSLSCWFGGVLFIAVSAPIIFKTVRENQPILPSVLSVNLENQHGTLLAGSIVAELLKFLLRIELVCAGGVLVGLLGQWFLIDRRIHSQLMMLGFRSALYLASVVLVIYDWRAVWPQAWKFRKEYIEHADEPEIANAAREQFDRFHKESVLLLSVVVCLLLGMILFSANISPNHLPY